MSIPSLRNRVLRLEQAGASSKVVGIVALPGESRAAFDARVRAAVRETDTRGIVYAAYLPREPRR